MIKRTLSALIFVPLILAAVWFGYPWFLGFLLLVGLLGAAEFYRLVERSGPRPFRFLGMFFVLSFIAGAHFSTPELPLLVSSAVVVTLLRSLFQPGDAWASWAWTIAGIFYLGWTLQHFLLLRSLEDGAAWVIFTLLVTFAVDTGAFFAGQALGRHRLAPRLSPGKTWEGAAGGVVSGLVATLVLAILLRPYGLALSLLLLLGFLIGIFAQLGDLVESALKRGAGAKESAKLIPGHGGLLDRLDSIVFTVVLVYYYVVWLS